MTTQITYIDRDELIAAQRKVEDDTEDDKREASELDLLREQIIEAQERLADTSLQLEAIQRSLAGI